MVLAGWQCARAGAVLALGGCRCAGHGLLFPFCCLEPGCKQQHLEARWMLVLGGARNRDTSTSPAAALLGGGVAKSWPPARGSPSRQLGSSGSDLEVVEMPFLVKRAKTLQKSLGWGLGQLPPSQAKPPEKKTQPPLPQGGRKELPGKEASAAAAGLARGSFGPTQPQPPKI